VKMKIFGERVGRGSFQGFIPAYELIDCEKARETSPYFRYSGLESETGRDGYRSEASLIEPACTVHVQGTHITKHKS
jgi:hypothetical protein